MEPTSFNVGDGDTINGGRDAVKGFNGADVFQRRRLGPAVRHVSLRVTASMEPTSFNVGDKGFTVHECADREASMEPTSFNVGDYVKNATVVPPQSLQWSRRLSTSET